MLNVLVRQIVIKNITKKSKFELGLLKIDISILLFYLIFETFTLKLWSTTDEKKVIKLSLAWCHHQWRYSLILAFIFWTVVFLFTCWRPKQTSNRSQNDSKTDFHLTYNSYLSLLKIKDGFVNVIWSPRGLLIHQTTSVFNMVMLIYLHCIIFLQIKICTTLV